MNHSSLHFAAASGNEMILIYLLDKHAKILTSNSGNTPLHVVRLNFLSDFNKILSGDNRPQKMVNKVLVLF